MPPMQQRASETSSPSPRRDALERLFVYWLVSTILLLLVVAVIVVYTGGALRAQASRAVALEERVAELEGTLDQVRSDLARLERQVRARQTQANPAPADTSAQKTTPPPTSVEPSPEMAPTEPAGLAESALVRRLDEVVCATPVTPADVLDARVAEALLSTALAQVEQADWSGKTWARLAVLGVLLGRTDDADTLAQRAAADGEPLITYSEVLIRVLLARGEGQVALSVAGPLFEQTAGAPTPRVLLAAALLAVDEPASADETLDQVWSGEGLAPYDRLLLARALVALEHWQRFEAVLAEVDEVPQGLSAEYSFVHAISLARNGRTVEALGILDYLAAHPFEPAGDPVLTAAWPTPRPDPYEVQVWRGVTLLHGHKLEPAREALRQAIQFRDGRPAAHYYLGLLEARAGDAAQAKTHLLEAVARSARMVAAWEALAVLELDGRDLSVALQHVDRALQVNPRRPAAHFLAALAFAKVSDRESAAEALRATFELDAAYVLKAKETDVLLRLFTPGDLDDLAAPEEIIEPPAQEQSKPREES